MSDRDQLLERFIQLQALSLVVDRITGEVFDQAVEGDWSQHLYGPTQVDEQWLHRDEGRFTAARVDLVAAHMFAELSTAAEWFAEQARHHADRANEQIVEEVNS
jgi:hypothetical protein